MKIILLVIGKSSKERIVLKCAVFRKIESTEVRPIVKAYITAAGKGIYSPAQEVWVVTFLQELFKSILQVCVG